ncbi:YheT family hydrolase [Salinibius halmophilus]|uniref:YheT family hydrolase n=1 Tax=Salinibius halmophilus TaxID=1853216 RepID=UPI000E672FDB|nr:alpha/beta fold hydrolase [Salinibius halmophilus]
MWQVSEPYHAGLFFRNAHVNTVAPTLMRKLALPPYQRHMVWLPDGDRLWLDQLSLGRKRCVIVSHGLEGHSRRHYVTGMARVFSEAGYDVLAWNFRGCGGEPNYQPRFYHSGATEDLDAVVRFALQSGYEEIAMVGFSMGGNLTLKYLGERQVDSAISSAVVLSVPTDLAGCAHKLAEPENKVYMKRFLRDLKDKVMHLKRRFPNLVDVSDYDQISTFAEFDERFTAPLHGFASAEDYWQQSSANGFLEHINTPVLMINAQDDPFLTDACFPRQAFEQNPNLQLLTPEHGGHVGFMQRKWKQSLWSERQAISFSLAHCQRCPRAKAA